MTVSPSSTLRREPALAHERGEQLGVVDHLVVAAEVGVLVGERVEAVRAVGDDLGHAGLVERRRRSARRTPGTRTRCPSGGPGRRCSSRAGRGSRSRRPPPAAASRLTRAVAARARRTTTRSRPSRGTRAPDRPAPSTRTPSSAAQSARSDCALPHGFEARSTSRSIGSASAGKLDSTITRWRRRSTMWSTCSIETGHACTQAPHVTQSQTDSSGTAPGDAASASRIPVRTPGRAAP